MAFCPTTTGLSAQWPRALKCTYKANKTLNTPLAKAQKGHWPFPWRGLWPAEMGRKPIKLGSDLIGMRDNLIDPRRDLIKMRQELIDLRHDLIKLSQELVDLSHDLISFCLNLIDLRHNLIELRQELVDPLGDLIRMRHDLIDLRDE